MKGPWGIRISPVLRMQGGRPRLVETYNVTGLNIGTFPLIVSPGGQVFVIRTFMLFDTRLQKDLKVWRALPRVSVMFDAFKYLQQQPPRMAERQRDRPEERAPSIFQEIRFERPEP